MAVLFAISGKGGVGKTTVSALLIHRLICSGRQPVLAIDADPNTCLDEALGVKVVQTVGRVREETKEAVGQGLSAGISKQEFIEIKISESLVEADNFDLIAMGRPEGAGCYCYANNVLKQVIKQISEHYPYVVLDNEAGLENLSRRIVQEVDVLVMVADPSKRGLETLMRLHQLASEMQIRYKKLVLIINRLKGDRLSDEMKELVENTNAYAIVGLPEDEAIATIAEEGRSMRNIPDNNPVSLKIDALIKELNIN